MSMEIQLQELCKKYFGRKEPPTVTILLGLRRVDPNAYSAYKLELGQITGLDLSEDTVEMLLKDPEIQKLISE